MRMVSWRRTGRRKKRKVGGADEEKDMEKAEDGEVE